ncbi:MAG: mannosyltransferase [Alyxoria varia]|nr:MAG: mannosyltransferase [Alyxoria varia]
MAAFIDWRGGSRIAQGLMWLGIGTVLGWPFIGLLAAPFVLGELFLAVSKGESSSAIFRMINGFVRSLIALATEVCFDSYFFRRYTSVPFNIVLYNIFSGTKKGPNIYGTEPWHFYVRNLLINFNFWFVLAVLTWPLVTIRHRYQKKTTPRLVLLRNLSITLPFYLWLAVFSVQPHKEERFMYPIYPCIALNAAISLHIVILAVTTQTAPNTKASSTSYNTMTLVKLVALGSFMLASISLGVLRSVGIATAYNAPLSVYSQLQHPDLHGQIQDSTNVCVGKEWYRFPSSYHLPNGSHLKFIRSEFGGLLPGEFSEIPSYSPGFGLFPGTYLSPSNMNDENRDDPSKYSGIEICDFLVDSRFPGLEASEREPDYADDEKHWERVACEPFLDTARTGFLATLVMAKTDETKAAKVLDIYEVTKPYLVLALGACAATWLIVRVIEEARLRFKGGKRWAWRRPSDVEQEKRGSGAASGGGKSGAEQRPWGVWTPSTFRRSPAPPYPDFSIHTTKPLPYRPFRYGPKYNVNMGLRPMPWDDWIELDNHYPKFHADKATRIAARGSKCCRTAPEAYDGAVELLEELCSYLPQRYPEVFQRLEDLDDEEDEGKKWKGKAGMKNLLTSEIFDLTTRPLPEDPMQMAARTTQDDLALMFEKPDGQYYLLAGAILLAGFWRLEDKFGMPLSEIHTSGDVPQFQSKLEKGMMNFFRRLKPDAPVLRNNYFIQVDDALPWSESIGSEDAPEGSFGWFSAEKNKAISNHYFRSERQSLRRLPRTGAVVFTIRTYFHPITEIAREPYVPGRLASAIRSWGEDVSRYKGRERYEEVLLEYLDTKHREQVEGGLDVSREDEVRGYPW